MASTARCLCFFFLLALSFSLQIQARESKFFSKFTHHYLRRKTRENPGSSLSPEQSSSLASAPAPESDVVEHGYGLYGHEPARSSDGAGEVKYVEADGMGKKTFRDFVMAYPNDNGNGWNGKKNENENEKKGMSDTRFLENGKYYYDVNNERNENKKQGMSEYVEENSFPENEENGNEHEHEAEKHGMGEKRYLVHGKYYSGYVTGEKGNEHENENENENENEKQGRDEFLDDENEGNGNEYETEKQGMSGKRYLVNGKYYSGYVTGSENGNGNGKLGMNEYVEEENTFPKNKENRNAYETEKQGMGDKKYLVNGKYYTGYVTGSENGNEDEKQGMDEYVEENNFSENKGYGNENEIEKQGMGGKKYFVNGKYYSGYVTGSKNGNEYEKQGINEYVKENNFPGNKGNGNGYETEKQGMDEKYLDNGKYYGGYVTGNEHGNENEKPGKNEYMEEENGFPENREKGSEFQTEKQDMGEKMYFVNGKYYSGYVTNSESGNENENQGMSEYVKDANSFLENKGNENETKNQRNGEKRYLVNGKYYYGYVTGENRDQNNQNYNSYEDFNKKNEFTNGYNENEFYNGNNEYEKEQEYVP